MTKTQRIMIDGGFTCPNRDGRVGHGGCTYCRNDSFAPSYCRESKSITEQLESGRKFFAGKYQQMDYLAYFQSYSGTYAPVNVLRERYDEALSVPGVKGIVIGTRPDCLPDEVLVLLQELCSKTYIKVELGVESCHNHVLEHINRGHSFDCAADAVRRLALRGVPVGVHMMLGLPTESREEMLEGADILSTLPIESIKLHQLQILKGTPMAVEYANHPEVFVSFPTAESYVSFVAQYIRRLRSDITVERIVSECSPDMLIAPRWGLKPYKVMEMLQKKNPN